MCLKAKNVRQYVPDIYATGISTGGVPGGGVAGDWLIEEDKGDDIIFTLDQKSDSNQDRSLLYLVREKEYVEFSVQACQNAFINLNAFEDGSQDNIEIKIGVDGNSKTRIKSNRFSTELQKDTKNILNCNSMQQFYASWANGTFIFGRGTEGTGLPILTQVFKSFTILYATILRGSSDGLQKWKVYEDQGNRK